ncbi:hypothetical protein ABFT43_00155 [Gordonia sp. B21]
MVWVFPDEVDAEALQRFNDALCRGRLHRQVVDARLPGARPYWVRAAEPVPLALDTETVDDDRVADWALDELRGVGLDPEAGRCWRLRAASTTAGRTVASLCALHLVADGRARTAAIVDALTEAARDQPGASRRSTSVVGDLLDVGRQTVAVGRAVARLLAQRLGGGETATPPDPRPVRSPLAERAPAAIPRWATASVPVEEWDAVAGRHGGTANTLFIAVLSGVLGAAGYTAADAPLKVGIPVSKREPGDLSANAMAGVSVYLPGPTTPGSDLGGIRDECRQAYRALDRGRRSAAGQLSALGWFLPPALLASHAVSDAGYPDAVASNVGEMPEQALIIGGVRATDVTVRGFAQGVDPAGRHRYGEGVQSWMVRTDTHVSFTVCGFDETVFPDDAALQKLVGEVLADWGLTHRIW